MIFIIMKSILLFTHIIIIIIIYLVITMINNAVSSSLLRALRVFTRYSPIIISILIFCHLMNYYIYYPSTDCCRPRRGLATSTQIKHQHTAQRRKRVREGRGFVWYGVCEENCPRSWKDLFEVECLREGGKQRGWRTP